MYECIENTRTEEDRECLPRMVESLFVNKLADKVVDTVATTLCNNESLASLPRVERERMILDRSRMQLDMEP